MKLVDRLFEGDVAAVARAISLIEDNDPSAIRVLQSVFPHTGRATVIGLTGSPGAGKSSLVDRLLSCYRRDDRKVGVVAVDPSSAYSGGAILGDRVRMQDHAADPDVFIRSMATRGYLGGLARTTNDAIDLLDAAGYDPVLVETVGVGQDEIDVVKTADVVAVVLVPGMGDDIQAIKAGILEIADLFVINKADHPGADRLQADIEYMLSLSDHAGRPRPEILRTVATADRGVDELRHGIDRYLEHSSEAGRSARRRDRAESRFRAVLSDRLMQRVMHEALEPEAFRKLVDRIDQRRIDPYTAAQEVLERMVSG